MKKRYLLLVVICLAGLILSACAPKNQLVGIWKDRISGSIFEFKSDGSLSATMLGISFDGKYTVADQKTLKLDLTAVLGASGIQIYTYKLNNNVLTLSMGSEVMVLDKVKVVK